MDVNLISTPCHVSISVADITSRLIKEQRGNCSVWLFFFRMEQKNIKKLLNIVKDNEIFIVISNFATERIRDVSVNLHI